MFPRAALGRRYAEVTGRIGATTFTRQVPLAVHETKTVRRGC
ncbi:hypothetical protein [Streptomyces sp. NPDC007856]